MGISLTKILAGAGISTAANALFPGIGMADAFARTAGMGMGNGLMRTAVSPSGSGGAGGQNRFGGPGSPQGAMPTRRFGATRETVGELKSGFKDWLVDPLQAKKEKREQARDTALAVRLGITGGEYSLTHRPAMSLIKKRSGDVQTNIMILQFRVQQFMARNLSAIASTLGVSKSKIGHEQPDPNRSWFGHLLSSIHKDLQQNKLFSFMESLGKHAINIGRILNPLTLGSRAKKGAKSFGEFMQRLAMGKEGYELMKDPEKLFEKAKLKQDFNTKAVNLMKINNEYQKHQMDLLYNLVTIQTKMLTMLGGSHQYQASGLTHDEFDGNLKTEKQLVQANSMRFMDLITTMQTASRSGMFGKFGAVIGAAKNLGYDLKSTRMWKNVEKTASVFSKGSGILGKVARKVAGYAGRKKQNYGKANERDVYVLKYLYGLPGFFNSISSVSSELYEFASTVDLNSSDFIYNKKKKEFNGQKKLDEFKRLFFEAIDNPDPIDLTAPGGRERAEIQNKEHEILVQAYEKLTERGSGQARLQVSFASSYDFTAGFNNLFKNLTGGIATDIKYGGAEALFKNFLRFGGDTKQMSMLFGSSGEDILREHYNSGLWPMIERILGGPLGGVKQQLQVGGVTGEYNRLMRSPMTEANPDMMFASGVEEAKSGIGSLLPSMKVSTTLSDIDDALLTKLTNKTINVKLVGVGGNVLTDITPIMVNFFQSLYAVGSQLVKDFSKMFDERRKQNKAILIEEPKDNYIDITTNAHGNVFSGGDISDYSGKIVDRPTFFRYDSIHKFAKGAGVMGETGNPEGIFPLAETKNGDLGLKGPSLMRVLLVDINGNPLPITMPSWFQNNQQNSFLSNPPQSGTGDNEKDILQLPFFGSPSTATKLLSWISGDKSEEKKAIDYNDNTTTTAERQQAIEDKRERKEEERREQEQQAVEEDKKSTLHKIADLLDPRTAIGKLVDKYRAFREKKKEEGFKLPFDISSWISKLGIGLIGNELIKMLPEGFFTGENGLVSKVGGFVGDVLGWMFDKAKKYVEENAFGWFQGAWEHFKEHPLLDAGILMTLFPGTVGKLLVKVAGKALMNPASIPSIIGVGGMVYNLIDSFSKSKDENGEFSLWKFLKEFFIGSESNLGSIIGKAGTYGYIGLKIGLRFGPHGALLGSLIGGALGSFIGSINTKDENGDFSIGEFLKSFFLGKDSAGGLANGAGNAIKWGLVGAAIGVPFGGIGAIPGFLLGAALGGIIGGVTGYLGYDKLETGSTVSKLLKWKPGSFAYKLANFPGAQFPPFIGPFIYGTIGTILDLGSMLFEKIFGVVNDAWMWLKKKIPFLGDDDDDEEQKKVEEAINKAKAAAEAERTKTVKYQDSSGNVLHINATGKDARYIEAAKTPEERRKRANETRVNQYKEERWIEESRSGEKKYDIKKYVELRKKWDKEDAERNEKYAHEIDIPVTNFSGKESVMGFNDFKSTKENAEEYQKLMNEKKDDDAIRFAKGIKAKQDAEEAKRTAKRDAELKKIEVGSSPDDLKLDAQRKASSAPAAMAAKFGVGDDDELDDMGSNVDVTELQEKFKGATFGEFAKKVLPKPNVYDLSDDTTQMQATPQEMAEAHGRMMEQIREGQKVKPGDPLYKRNVQKYNEAAQNIDLSSAGFGLSAPGPDPSSVPAAAKSSEDASKKKDESKGKSGTPAPSASPAAAPSPASPSGEMPAPAPSSGETPASTPSDSGELNWIEKLISQTIQGAFKIGGAVVNAAKNGYNAAQQAFNGGGGIGSGAPFSGGNKAPGIGGRYGAISGKRDELVLPLNQRAKGPDGKPMEWSQATNNPGNVGNTDQGGTFIFPDLQSGIKAQRDLLKERYSGGLTLRQMAMKYTPTMWREALPIWSSKSGIGTEEVPNLNDPAIMARLLKAIHIAEGSAKWVPQEEVDYALGLKPLPAGYKPKDYRQLTEKGKAFVAGGGSGADGGAGAPAGPLPNASPAVQKYLAIMERNTHGSRYEMSGRRDNPGIYDCSSFVSRSLREAGYKIPTPSPTTEDLGAVLKANGFQYYPLRMREGLTQAPPELQPGDILLNRGNGWHNHVETYWGNNKIVGAHSTRPEGRKNDEVSVKAFYSTGYPGFYRLVSASGGYAPNDLPPSGSVSKWNLVDPGYGQPGGSVQDLSVNSSTDLRWPTDSTVVNSGMGPRNPSDFAGAKGPISRQHGGTDIHAPSGSSIYSAMSGKIVGTSPNYGTVEIEHPDGWRSKYLHMKKFFVKAGQSVKAGDTIGEAGGIGKDGAEVFTPHLHFEMLKDGKKVDPEQVYAQNKSQTKGIGGPEFTPRINKQMNEYFENNGVGGPEISVKSDNRVIAELKKLQMIMIGVMKAAGKPSIAVSAPQEQGDPKSKGVDGGKFDNMTENMFSQLGGMLGDLNVATTGLGTQIA